MELTKLEKQQVILEHKYHPKRKKEMLIEVMTPLKEDNDPIWASVHKIVKEHQPKEVDDFNWGNTTTMNLLTRLIDLDGTNTPIQSIVFAFVDKEDKIANAMLSMSILIDVAENTKVCDIKTGTTMTGEDSVTIYPKLNISLATRMEMKKLYSGLPMVTPPRPWTTNKDGGYLTDICKSNIILGGVLKQHNEPVNYEPINYLQSVGFKINKTFFETVQDDKEAGWTTDARGKKQKTGYVNNRQITQFYLDADTPFYFVQRVDNRCRSYATGYNLNPQGYTYQKAVLNFAEEKKISNNGSYWVKVAIAGLAGHDKETFYERLDWYDKKLSKLVQRAIDTKNVQKCTLDINFMKLIEEADDEGYLFEATVINYIEAQL